MRLALIVAVALVGGCTSEGKPSQAVGSALDSFSRAFNGGKKTSEPARPYQLPVQPFVAQPPSQQGGVTAHWTGQSRQVQTVTGGMAWECVYNYAGQNYVLLFNNICPTSAQLR